MAATGIPGYDVNEIPTQDYREALRDTQAAQRAAKMGTRIGGMPPPMGPPAPGTTYGTYAPKATTTGERVVNAVRSGVSQAGSAVSSGLSRAGAALRTAAPYAARAAGVVAAPAGAALAAGLAALTFPRQAGAGSDQVTDEMRNRPPLTNDNMPRAPGAMPPAATEPNDPNFKPHSTAIGSPNYMGPADPIESNVPGTAVIRGHGQTRVYSPEEVKAAGNRLNVLPGAAVADMMVGGAPLPGTTGYGARDTQGAVSVARRDAAARGDWEAVDRSYMSPEQRAALPRQKAQEAVLNRISQRANSGQPIGPQLLQQMTGALTATNPMSANALKYQNEILKAQDAQYLHHYLNLNDQNDPGGMQRTQLEKYFALKHGKTGSSGGKPTARLQKWTETNESGLPTTRMVWADPADHSVMPAPMQGQAPGGTAPAQAGGEQPPAPNAQKGQDGFWYRPGPDGKWERWAGAQ